MKKAALFFFALAVLTKVTAQTPKTDAALNTQGTVIKNETAPDANTPLRVGTWMLDENASKVNNNRYAGVTALGTDTYTASVTPAIVSYPPFYSIKVTFINTNVNPATLSLNGLAAKSIKKILSGALVSLSAGDICTNCSYWLMYNGTDFQILGGGSSGGGGGSGVWGAITGTLTDQTDLKVAMDLKQPYLKPTSVKTATYNAVDKDFVPVDATGATVQINLPTSPAESTIIGVKMIATGSSNLTQVVVGGSDKFNVAGGATTFSLTAKDQTAYFQFHCTTSFLGVCSNGLWYSTSQNTLTNSAVINEVPKIDGTLNLVTSGLYSSTVGNLDLGSTSLTGDRTISAKSSSASNSLYLQTTNGSSTATNALQIFISGINTDIVAPPGKLKLISDTYLGRSLVGGPFGFDFTNYPAGLSEVVATNNSSPNSVLLPFRIAATASSGTPANGFGVGMEFAAQNASSTNIVGSTISSVADDIVAGTEDFSLRFKTITAGTLAEKIRFTSLGEIGLGGPNYGTAGQAIVSGGPGAAVTWGAGGGSGTVSTVSVVTANGLAGTVANPTTTPALTLSTTITGLVKGNGTAFSAASAGTDYQAPLPSQTNKVNYSLGTNGTTPRWDNSNRVFNVENYGAVHNGNSVFDGAITSGTNILTSTTASFSVADIGKIILVSGAGVTGAPLKTTVSGYTNSTTITLTASASTTVSSANVLYGTDDTAYIQLALDAAFDAGGGTVYFPNGIYIINGVLQTVGNGRNNSQLYIKSNSISTKGDVPTINLIGESSPLSFYYALDPSLNGVILVSTLITTSGSFPSILSTKDTGNPLNFNFSPLFFNNISFRAYTNKGANIPYISCLNLRYAAVISARNLATTIDVRTQYSSASTLGSNTFGMILSSISNNGPNVFENCFAAGFDYGMIVGEHSVLNGCVVLGNGYGLTVLSNNYQVSGWVQALNNYINILYQNGTLLGIADAGRSYSSILDETEDTAGAFWYKTVYMFSDAGNTARGSLSWLTVAGTYVNPFLSVGGSGLIYKQAEQVFPKRFNTAPGVPITNTNVSPNTAIFELSSGTATSTDTYFGNFRISTNQSGTANAVGLFDVVNSAIGATEKRMYIQNFLTDGATNTVSSAELLMQAGSLVTTLTKRPTGYTFSVPVTVGTGNNIVGVATNNSATAGNIGEEVPAIQSTYTNYTTTATYQNITSITLTAGDWDISAFGSISANGATLTTSSNAVFVISTTTASAAGAVEGKNIHYVDENFLGSSIQSMVISPYRVSLSGSTTYYLNSQATFTLGNPQFVGSIRARRMR